MEKTKSILEWFRKGCKDELHGSSSICSDIEIENQAYMLGAKLAEEGKVKKSDELTDEKIYVLIANHDLEKYLIKK